LFKLLRIHGFLRVATMKSGEKNVKARDKWCSGSATGNKFNTLPYLGTWNGPYPSTTPII